MTKQKVVCGSSEIQFIHLMFWEHINTIKMQLFRTLPVRKKQIIFFTIKCIQSTLLYNISVWDIMTCDDMPTEKRTRDMLRHSASL